MMIKWLIQLFQRRNFYCDHQWTSWYDVGVFGMERYQERKCLKCNKKVQKSIGWNTR